MRNIAISLYRISFLLAFSGNILIPLPAGAQEAAIPVGIVEAPCAPAVQNALRNVDLRQRDYGNLCRFRAENAALKATGKPVRAVFIGDSITELWGMLSPETFTGGIVNRGISGQTSSQLLVRFRQDVVDLAPRVVHILVGANDIAGNTGPTTLSTIEDNIVTMAEIARAHHIRVVIASVPPASAFPWRPEVRPAADIRKLNGFLRAYAQTHGLVYADYYTPLANAAGGMDPVNAEDGVHPSLAAYKKLNPLALAAIGK